MDEKPLTTNRPSKRVAEHYNAIPVVNIESRKDSVIIGLKRFNNWLKAVLISGYTRRNDYILEIGCGKGGDLIKWAKIRVKKIIGLDIAENSIQEATTRYSTMKFKSFDAKFYTLDCFKYTISSVIEPEDYKADVVSAQFCIHYAAESEAQFRMLLKNVSDHLRPGGYFIGTTPNAYWLTKKLASVEGTKFGNSIYSVDFEKKESDEVFGRKYVYSLVDAIDSCPEYLVHFPTFKKLALEYDLKLVKKQPFHEFYNESITHRAHIDLLYRMKVVEENKKTISLDEWEAIGKVFVLN
ncbi:hypothetical protein BB560_007047 [Smittium megazygosporum]|uniref:mRNA cap guanine-N(7) methyltransferase n=1 Tax=Smittium megazygosporum TaxID=133381 RepID=A0A2T9XZ46_9FUNG|nr:hypothetical protein BB560_007047 [Smittium megazygosporum]